MPRKSQRDKNLEEAKHKRRLAQSKVSKLESRGIHVRKAEVAPIVPLSELEGMNARQLRSHIKELERFNSRETSFVKGFNGEPLVKSDVQELHRLQMQRNARFQRIEGAIAEMPNLPGQDQTPFERALSLSQSRRTGVAKRVTEQFLQVPEFITSQESLQSLIKAAKWEASNDWFPRTINRRMNSIDALLENSGYADMKKQVHALSVEQQLVLMEFTTFAEVARERFGSGEDGRERVERRDRDYNLRNNANREADVRGDLQEIIDYVKQNTSGLSSARLTTSRKSPFVKGKSQGGRRKK